LKLSVFLTAAIRHQVLTNRDLTLTSHPEPTESAKNQCRISLQTLKEHLARTLRSTTFFKAKSAR
jgi:hypothetical protein